jgi:hypothetical protein
MKKKPVILEELIIWFRGRFSLTAEEKFWLLLILLICWAGLVGKYFYLKNQNPEPLTSKEAAGLMIHDE